MGRHSIIRAMKRSQSGPVPALVPPVPIQGPLPGREVALVPDEAPYGEDGELLRRSPLFDAAYYRSHNADVTGDPLGHYVLQGWREGRRPSLAFDPEEYLAANPDVAAAGGDPLLHWLRYGQFEGRLRLAGPADPVETRRHAATIRGAFDADHYRALYPDVAGLTCDPLDHYVTVGWRQKRSPAPGFDPDDYLEANPDVVASNKDPLLHWVSHGRGEGRLQRPLSRGVDPAVVRDVVRRSGFFDAEYYALNNPDVMRAGADPLEHYLAVGWREHLRPSAEFDPERYLAAYPEAAGFGVELITFHVFQGAPNGHRLPPCALARGQRAREVERVRASGLFDPAFYLGECPVAAELGVDPVLHYVVCGYRSLLDPAPGLSTVAYQAAFPSLRVRDLNLVSFLLERRARGFRDEEAPSGERWVFAGYDHRLPDEVVHFERMEGERFFGRYGFRFATDGASHLLPRAVAALANLKPTLRIARDVPDVSIIIPVYGQTHFVLGCLHSLARHLSRRSVEILVMDDRSPSSHEVERLADIPWVRYVRREQNGGFIATCNDGAERARGRVLVFLNSDTRVVPGWLDELADTFELFPKAGLVGSKLFNADGSLQEAGGIIWRDGSAWNYGRGADPNRPEYCFARQADYCSGASIAVTRHAWIGAGGFDTAYAPAYCEDADLAVRLRKLGFETWYQPLSRVLHYEGKTHGRDTATGMKAYQVVNLKRLASRHAGQFARHRPNGVWPDDEAIRARTRRMLILDAETPKPDRDAGSDLTAKLITGFQKLGYDVTFVPQSTYAYDGRYSDALARQGVELAYAPYCRTISDLLHYRDHAVQLCLVFRHEVASAVVPTLRTRLPTTPILFHNVDLHYLRERRKAELDQDTTALVAAARTMTAELSVIARTDATIVTNAEERHVIAASLPDAKVVVMPYVAETLPSRVPFAERRDILFLGGFRHPPNEDAVRFFAERIWPILVRSLPDDARFTVIGADPTASLRRLAGGRIEVIGYVEDLAPWFDRARVFVAPLRFGAGVKGKVIQSLRHGLPAVVTSIGSEGVGLRDGEHVLVADEPETFAEAVLRVYRDPAAWAALQQGGYDFIETAVSWDKALASCREAVDGAAATWIARADRQRTRVLERLARA